MSTDIGRRISSAIAVRWTPALAGRVERRIEHRLARRRQRRRAALVALALLGMASVGFAFTRSWVRSRAGAASSQPATRAFGPPAAQPAAPDLSLVPAAEVPPTMAAPSRATPVHRLAPAARQVTPEGTVTALFAAADAARLAGHPADAVAPLTAIFTRHPKDPRAAVAAYQLGRVLALDLHERTRAAAAFARAHDLDPNGPLAADAAAHAAETRSTKEKAK
jgi:TolA-binding protein